MSDGTGFKAPAVTTPAPAGSVSIRTRLFGRRRRLLVNPRYQLRASITAVVVVFTLLLLLNVSLLLSSAQGARTVRGLAPELGQLIRSQERVQLDLILAGSAVFLVGVFLVALRESHKTAGAALNLRRRLRDIQTGHYYSRLALRRSDGLRELEDAFNNMARALSDRTWEEIETLRDVGERLAELHDDQARTLASTLHTLADRKRKLVER